ncbi:hypothetical protein [Streptomyces sp. KR80]|uniref:hypothetical protein n=1 Tax=Streptomyces sp. KR80 TaxID=3457426 RepID=UPI003FD6B413
MARNEEPDGWSAAKFSCPVCKEPVPAVATRRRKVFGAYVPVWEPGPCGNPECPAHEEPPGEQDGDGLPEDGPKESQRG